MKKLSSFFLAVLLSSQVMSQDAPVWTRSMSAAPDTAYLFPVKTANDGNNFVYTLSTYYKNTGPSVLNKIYLNKYSDTGGLVWSLIFDNGGSGEPRGFDMAVDNNGNCYIAGGFMASLNFQPLLMKVNTAGGVTWIRDTTTAFNNGRYEQVILKNGLLYLSCTSGIAVFNVSGTEQWSHNTVIPSRIAVDNAGQMVVSGMTSGNETIFRYDITGALNFSDSSIQARRLACDSANSMYLLTDYASAGYELVKYDSAGIFQWSTNSFPAFPSFGDIGYEVLTDYYNDVILVGLSDTMYKFSPAGNLIWRKPMNGIDSYIISATITWSNFIAVAGSVDSVTGYNMAVRYYDVNGNQSWEGYYNGNMFGQEYTVSMTENSLAVYVLENNADSMVLAKFTDPFFSAIDYSLLCIDSVWYDPTDSTFINVSLFNGNASQLNYPSVQIVSPATGDTIGNPSNFVNFFAHMGNGYQTYHDTITVAGITDFSNYTFLVSEGFGDTTVVVPWCSSLSVFENLQNEITVFPNPASGSIHINWQAAMANSQVKIYDMLGELVHQQIISSANEQIDISSLAAGIYILRLQNGESPGVVRFVKQ
jgi:hypothetical protein